MVIDEELESELSSLLEKIEVEGLGIADEEGVDVLSHDTEEALVEVLNRVPLAEFVDTVANSKAQISDIDASLEVMTLTANLVSASHEKPHFDSALELMGSLYNNLSEKLLRSSVLLNMAQDMTGARILLRPALESGIQGTFVLTAIKAQDSEYSSQSMEQCRA